MPETTITIDRDQRGGSTNWSAITSAASRTSGSPLRRLRLLQDIGWDEHDQRETFDLTMPVHDLMELLKRLHGEAVKILVGSGSSEARSRRDDADTDRRFQLGYETCRRCSLSSIRGAGSQRDR
jgi:hypothetical protein